MRAALAVAVILAALLLLDGCVVEPIGYGPYGPYGHENPYPHYRDWRLY
jgi:hypothetical protein